MLGTLPVPAKTIEIYGQRIAYYEAGTGRDLILLSNLGSDSNDWFGNFPEFAKHYHVVAIDLLGMGKSDKPMIDYKMNTWTEFIAEFMRLKGIHKATVGGAVMGGALSVQFALDYPALVDGIIVAASKSGPGKHEGAVKGSGGVSSSMAAMRESLLLTFFDKALVTDELVRSRYEYRLRTNDGYVIQRHLSDHRVPYSEQELSAIHVPALFVWCRNDEITPLQWGRDYANAVKGATFVEIDKCGHLPNLEQPKEFNRAVISFLARSQP